MADEYVSTITLEVNGQQIDDFSAAEEKARVLRKAVNLMKKTGTMKVTPRYGLSVDYVVPKNKAEFGFDSVEDGTLTIDLENGRRITYTGVSTLEVGATKYDGDKEATRTIEFVATGRVEE